MGRVGLLAFTEWRRMQAWRLKQAGWKQHDIAIALGVTKGAVSQWITRGRRKGEEALRNHPSAGRPARLGVKQRALIADCLWHGAESYGFRGEVWTCARVARVLAEEFDVGYSRSQVSRLLKKIGWTPQVPLVRAIQRDESSIERWRLEIWPQVKQQAQKERRRLVFIDESGFYLLPSVVRTYAPKGSRAVLKEWLSNDHLSVMGGLTSQGKIYTLVRQEPLNGLHTVMFLHHLLRMAGTRLLIVWDRSPIHRRAEVKDFLASGAARNIHIEFLPPYAPDLNPVEWTWGYLKANQMRNLVCLDLEQLHYELHLALGRLRRKPHLAPAFFGGAGLDL